MDSFDWQRLLLGLKWSIYYYVLSFLDVSTIILEISSLSIGKSIPSFFSYFYKQIKYMEMHYDRNVVDYMLLQNTFCETWKL